MKKLVFALAALCVAATPVLACDGHDKPADAAAPKTADKKEAPKTDKAPAKDTAKTAKPAEKKPADTTKKADKVSQR